MKIDQRLNIVIPVEVDKSTYYVHSCPVSREVFEEFFEVISRTFARIFTSGLGVIAGPRVAGLTLRNIAKEMGVWDGPAGVEQGLINEVRRLTHVLVPNPTGQGWTTLLLQEALDGNLISADDASEVENALAFFIVNSAMLRKSDLAGVLAGAAKLWDAQTTLLTSTAFASSLPTLIEADNSGTKTEAGSLVPS